LISRSGAADLDALTFEQALAWHDPLWTSLHNRLHRPRRGWQGQYAGRAFTVAWEPGEATVEDGVEVWLTLGGALLKVTLPAQGMEVFGMPDGLLPDSPSGSLLLELALLELIIPLEHLIGQPIRVLDLEASRAVPSLLPLSVNLGVRLGDDLKLNVPIQLSEAATLDIADALDRHAPATLHDLGHLRLSISVDSAEAWLTLPELLSLLPGDVVMLDPWADSHVRLRLGTSLWCRARLEGTCLQLIEQQLAVISMKEHHMTEVDAGPSLDEVQLKLVCRLGSVELSLAQLRELGEGSLLQMTPSMQEGVELLINGRRVGLGQLVKIGDGLGVRILSFSTI